VGTPKEKTPLPGLVERKSVWSGQERKAHQSRGFGSDLEMLIPPGHAQMYVHPVPVALGDEEPVNQVFEDAAFFVRLVILIEANLR
jgi:hypothetical protein